MTTAQALVLAMVAGWLLLRRLKRTKRISPAQKHYAETYERHGPRCPWCAKFIRPDEVLCVECRVKKARGYRSGQR